MKINLKGAVLSMVFALAATTVTRAYAEETTVEKVQNEAGDAKVKAKKTMRKLKRKVRDKTGNQSLSKDIKDAASNVGDDVSNETKKVKRKVD